MDAINPSAALAALAAAGVTAASVAADLGVHRTTVARWKANRTRPNRANLGKLRRLVDDLLAAVLAGDAIADCRQGTHLQRAKHALTTEQERAELAQLADSIRATMRAAGSLRQPATTRVDPFALIGPNELDTALDAAFGPAARDLAEVA
jgi:transcriptional regulator with XRE-family HTH domain